MLAGDVEHKLSPRLNSACHFYNKVEGKAPYSFEWKFSDGLTLTGENVTRSFELPGKYTFYLTVIDGNGDKATSKELYTNVLQEMPKEEVTANATPTQHN